MFIVGSGASLHMMGESSLSFLRQGKQYDRPRTIWRPKREWHRSFHRRGKVLHPGTRQLFAREVGGGFACGTTSWTIVQPVGVFLGVNHALTKSNKTSCAPATLSILSSRSVSKGYSIHQVRPPPRESLCMIQKRVTPFLELLELFLWKFVRRRRSLGHKDTSSRKEARRDPTEANRSSFGCDRCGQEWL